MELSAQHRYGRWLLWGARLGFVLLLLAFAAYIAGAPPVVPLEKLPEVWSLAAADFPRHAAWGSDTLVIAAIAVIASCSIPCLLAIVPVFARARERVFLVICLLEVAVLLVAASGLLTAGH